MEKVKIGLLGMGTVGSGVWNILKDNHEEVTRNSGCQIQIAKVLVSDIKKDRGLDLPSEILTVDYDEILNDDSIEIVVEVMGGIEPAKDYILRAIDKKKHVISANKALIANHGLEIIKKAKENQVLFLYEASTAGGIPILSTIRESLGGNKIEEVMGILNGTTNYILTKMSKEKLDYADVLKEAQDMGYAEQDPTADVEGFDAAHKLAILGALSFGTEVEFSKIYREGISKISPIDIEYAKELGYAIKLLAIGNDKEGKLEMRVHPTFIPLSHPLAIVNDAFNAVFLKGNAVGELMFYGQGAGDLPTGSAVVGDIIDVVKSRSNIFYTLDPKEKKDIKPMDETHSMYYVRLLVKDKPGVFAKIAKEFGDANVSLSSVIQKGREEASVFLVFITHSSREGNVRKAMENILKLDVVEELGNLIRVEDGVEE